MSRSMSIFEHARSLWMRSGRAALLVSALVLLGACAHTEQRNSLYQDLGGEQGVAQMVNEITIELHADPKLADLFTETDDDYFKERLNEQICMLTGGGCEYTGLDMPEAHSGMDLSAAQFNDFVEACRRAMTRAGVSVGNQNRLLAILAPMRADVIHH